MLPQLVHLGLVLGQLNRLVQVGIRQPVLLIIEPLDCALGLYLLTCLGLA
ncbi:MAG: hypothetical protein ACYC7H_04195 [Chloroflexota bacterium]